MDYQEQLHPPLLCQIPPATLTPSEEIANTITHGLGLALSLVGAGLLMNRAESLGDWWIVAGCGIYTATLIALYAASTLSHTFREPRLRNLFRRLDQACIYLLIAGSITPFALAYLSDGDWWLLLASMWCVALAGFASKILWGHRVNNVAIWIYLLLGWMPMTAIQPVISRTPAECLWWMLLGGVAYSVGTIFLILDTRVKYFHAVWHLFVIGGSTFHYFVILHYVVLQNPL